MNLVFDAMGTLFDLAPLRERLGAPATEAWFERILHSAAALTILDEFVPFKELARTTLATTTAKLALDVDHDDVLAQLQQLPPADGAREALERADRAFVLTNGGRDGGEKLLENAGLSDLVERVFGVDEVRAYKPDPRPYRLVLDAVGDATLVAAHAWDCAGALRAGMRAVWVRSEEKTWPFPEGLFDGDGLREVARLVDVQTT
jgi:2-haloacid dehalogenase